MSSPVIGRARLSRNRKKKVESKLSEEEENLLQELLHSTGNTGSSGSKVGSVTTGLVKVEAASSGSSEKIQEISPVANCKPASDSSFEEKEDSFFDDDLFRFDSQRDGDPECEVRWDCRSPETIRQLKKMRGQYSKEDVKKIVANFNDAHLKPERENQTLVHVFQRVHDPFPPQQQMRAKERINKRRQRPRNRQAVQEMIDFLHGIVAKQKLEEEERAKVLSLSSEGASSETNAETSPSSTVSKDNKVETNDDDCWSDEDLFQDNSFLIEATQNPEKYLNTSVDVSTQRQKSSESAGKNTVNKHISYESPNESVIPSSYIIRQSLPVRKNSNQSNQPNQSSLRQTNLFNRPLVKNTKPYGNVATNRSNSTKVNYCGVTGASATATNIHGAPLNKPNGIQTNNMRSSSAYGAKCTSSVKQWASQSKQIQNAPIPESKTKTSLRKHSSFQTVNSCDSDKVQTQKACQVSGTMNSSINSSFRRSLSFDNSRRVANVGAVANPRKDHQSGTSPASDIQTGSTVMKPMNNNYKNNCSHSVPKNNSNHAVPKTSVPQINSNPKAVNKADVINLSNDGFDESLPEDLLQQLLEPDNMFDSQADILSSVPPQKAHQPSKVGTFGENKNKFLQGPSKKDKFTFKNTKQTEINGRTPVPALPANTNKTHLKSLSHQQDLTVMEPLISPVKPHPSLASATSLHAQSPAHAFFKKAFGPRNDPVSVAKASKHRQSFGPDSSTPVKVLKSGQPASSSTTDPQTSKGQECTDSFLENAFDDSFLTEDALFESQILPMLEKAESEAFAAETQVCYPKAVSSPIKCSPEEIEKKRRAALQRRTSKLLSQTGK